MKTLTLVVSIFFSAYSIATADIVQFNDAIAWGAAAGHIDFTENFNDFASDTSFSVRPLQLNGFSVEESGASIADLNFIDAIPFIFTDLLSVDGTSYLAGGVEFAETDIEFWFDENVSAFGGDFVGADGDEMLGIELIDESGGTLGLLDPLSDDSFLGFVADAGEQVAGLRFFSQIDDVVAREAFGLDNIRGVNAIPEPNAAILLLTSAVFLLQRRLRNGRNN